MREKILEVHHTRRVARRRERALQEVLDAFHNTGRPLPDQALGIPDWARGVKVERAGLFQHAVVATERRGH